MNERPGQQQAQSRDYPMRRWLVLLVFTGVVAVLGWRTADLQIKHKDFLRQHGDARALRVVDIPAHRGMITDRYGEPLAISTAVESIWTTPRQLIGAPQLDELAQLLGYSKPELQRLLQERRNREFVYLKRHADPELVEQVRALELPGIYTQPEYRRYYPSGEVTAHLIGFNNIDDRGQEGLELAYNDWLQGTPGAKRVLKDRLGRTVENVESIRSSKPGRDLVLSIDRRIQYLAYLELKSAIVRNNAHSGSIVLLDVTTGEVLALANQPSYNPNNRAGLKNEALRNRALTDLLEPGSTLKPFTIAAALESGQFVSDQVINTAPGFIKVADHTIRDINNYGELNLTGILGKSSNVGISKIALTLQPEIIWNMFDRLGLGRITGTGFPGEAGGRLAAPAGWSDVELVTAAFGYGLSITPLQLAQAYATLAAGGIARPVSLLRKETADQTEPVPGQQVIDPAVARQVLEMLEHATLTGGTGTRAQVKGYRVAGKTGTVHKIGVGGYAPDRYMSMFAGIAPVSDPRLALVVVIDEPQTGVYYGGQVAAPVFGKIMADALRLLNLPPDDLPTLKRHSRILAQHPDKHETTERVQ
ncbi:MAG: penicillin-binding transpeptidase domain-containing protein [Gammaproteobacteria bacterium]